MKRSPSEAHSSERETESAAQNSSRRQFVRLMGVTGAAAGFSMMLGACGDDDDGGGAATSENTSKGRRRDREIVDYALTLEFVEADFYDAVIDAGVLEDQNVTDMAILIRENEREHVDALSKVFRDLGGNPTRPKTTFESVIDAGPEKVLETAAMVENLGAAAYLGQAPRIQSREILASALAIHSVEGRHAAALNRVIGKTIVPSGAFAEPASMEEVLPKVKPFIVS